MIRFKNINKLAALFIFIVILLLFFNNSENHKNNLSQEIIQTRKKAIDEYNNKNYLKAIRYQKDVISLLEKKSGSYKIEVGMELDNLAYLYHVDGRYSKAISLYLRSLDIYENILGMDHPVLFTILSDIGYLYYSQDKYEQAENFYKRALDIYEDTKYVEKPKVANTLYYLGKLYRTLGNYSRATHLYKQSLDILEKELGPKHTAVAYRLNNLARLYHDQVQYSKAEPLFKRSIEILEMALGPNHPDVATSLKNMAGLYYDQGLYSKAEPLYKRSLEIHENTLEPDHPSLATSLNNLAELHRDQGLYHQAKPLIKRSLTIKTKVHGPNHPSVVPILNSLANLYHDQGLYSKAEPLYKRSLEIYENASEPDYPNVATILSNLGGLYFDQGLYSKAKPFFMRSLEIDKKNLGPNHPHIATSLNNLGMLNKSLGHYHKAKPLLNRSLEILEKTVGLNHPNVATNFSNLAFLHAATFDLERAFQYSYKSLAADEIIIDQILGLRTEAQALKFLSTKMGNLETFLNLINQYHLGASSIVGRGLDVWLRRKGIVLEAQKRFQEVLAYSEDPHIYQLFQELSQTKTKLSHMIFSVPYDRDSEVDISKLKKLEKEKDALESQLVQLSHAFASQNKELRADRFKVAAILPQETALIEFVRIREIDFQVTGVPFSWLPDKYLAFILHSGEGEDVKLIDLGPAELIDDAIALFREAAADKEFSESEVIKASSELYDMVFKPISAGLGSVREIFISPDGNLNLIPFEVLHDDQGHFLIEDYTFNYLYSGRQLLGGGSKIEESSKALIMGDPDFEMSSDLVEEEPENVDLRSVLMELRVFRPLPGTKKEVRKISQIIGLDNSLVYTGAEATEENLFAHNNPSILHLATHGFFREDMSINDNLDLPAIRSFDFMPHDHHQTSGRLIMADNPLLRSGLILAGANQTIRGETDSDQGIVTAEKILDLRLWGTDLVVLSACDTGMGEVLTGEGVFGLRRAFNQVGAKSLVMSMWKVPDKETKELMVNFYRNIFEEELSYSQALRQASLDQLEKTRERYGHANPFYWGGFIFSGNPKSTNAGSYQSR